MNDIGGQIVQLVMPEMAPEFCLDTAKFGRKRQCSFSLECFDPLPGDPRINGKKLWNVRIGISNSVMSGALPSTAALP